jgi:hypothetical protein
MKFHVFVPRFVELGLIVHCDGRAVYTVVEPAETKSICNAIVPVGVVKEATVKYCVFV